MAIWLRDGRLAGEMAIYAAQAAERTLRGGAGLLGREGKRADAVGFAVDPLADIHAIRDVRFVMKGSETVHNELG